MKQLLKEHRKLVFYFILLYVTDAIIDVYLIKQPIEWGANAILSVLSVILIMGINSLAYTTRYPRKKKNRCEDCKYNDTKAANAMFFTGYCTLKECQTSGDYKCEYKISTQKI